jgi:hypothetical protein
LTAARGTASRARGKWRTTRRGGRSRKGEPTPLNWLSAEQSRDYFDKRQSKAKQRGKHGAHVDLTLKWCRKCCTIHEQKGARSKNKFPLTVVVITPEPLVSSPQCARAVITVSVQE